MIDRLAACLPRCQRTVRPTACVALYATLGCAGSSTSPPIAVEEDTSFSGPFPVQITGYAGDAMEPFITRNGQHLLFNNRNDPADLTDLHIAERVNDSSFTYLGPLAPLNSVALDAVAAGTADGTIYFVSLRSYFATFSTIHRSTLAGSVAGPPSLMATITTGGGGLLDFDVDVAADGATLTVARGRFTGGAIPTSADLVLYQADGAGFIPSAAGAATYGAVNTAGLEYAPATSADGLLLSFTRLAQAPGSAPTLWIARRAAVTDPWGAPARIRGPSGMVEAGSWSPDARTLYYHALAGDRFMIQRLTR